VVQRLAIAVVLAICGAPLALGQGTSTQMGFGLSKCSEYVRYRENPAAAAAFDGWVLGYLSGVNFMLHTSRGVDLLSDQSSEMVATFIGRYCRASPGKSVAEAANEFWFGLAERARK